jgi:2,3-bisphosphoglycerate-dependent phosphoglycerate mutase
LQAQRLGHHLAQRAGAIGRISHIFSSDLQRAFKTAEAIRDAQSCSPDGRSAAGVDIVQLAELREKDFGSLEGRRGSDKTRPESLRQEETGSGPETLEHMAVRAVRFLNAVLFPLLNELNGSDSARSVVIVAHGLIHSFLWQAFKDRVGIRQEFDASSVSEPSVDSLGNTGYHEAVVKPAPRLQSDASSTSTNLTGIAKPTSILNAVVSVAAVSCQDHLAGLKKTRGGIGSAAFDKRQRTMDSFFGSPSKRRKTADDGDSR